MRYDRELLAGAIATASPGRLRIRSNWGSDVEY
jgi:hypothetical protein